MCSFIRKRSCQTVLFFLLISAWLIVIFTMESDAGSDPVYSAFKDRRIYVREMCLKHKSEVVRSTRDILMGHYPKSSTPELTAYQKAHILVDHNHKVLYCYAPKVGCTNWKRIFLMLRKEIDSDSPLDIRHKLAHEQQRHLTLGQLNATELDAVLTEYKKFMFVRHPLERLLSAYRDKFESKTSSADFFHQRMGRRIIKAFRKDATEEALRKGDDVTFLEFLKYMLHPSESLKYESGQSYNEHWEPIHRLCNPCHIPYDYVGIYEDIVEESNVILKDIGAGDIKYPATKEVNTHETKSKMKRYYGEIPLKFIRALGKVYKMDMLLFNYTLEASSLMTDFN